MTAFSRLSLLLGTFLISFSTSAQQLQPGFDKEEYRQMMKVSARFGSENYFREVGAPEQYDFIYRSKDMGLGNCWELWTNKAKNVAVISIRGTTAESVSWLANFYAAMVPAKGELNLGDTMRFQYQLAENSRAAVHVGWLLSMAFLANDIQPYLDSVYKAGVRNVLLMGHSQGGAINFLLTAYYYNLQKLGKLPKDIRFKTYCSAGPKPGNLYFAYEYEAMTQGGWAYNVVNAADWVPQTPVSIQTLYDFNNTNPFVNARALIRKQKFPNRQVMRHFFNKLDRPTRKADRNYRRYLGKATSGFVKKQLVGFKEPEYFKSNDYVRTGNTVVLYPDAAYFTLYPESKENVFMHHFHQPYLYLLDKLKL